MLLSIYDCHVECLASTLACASGRERNVELTSGLTTCSETMPHDSWSFGFNDRPTQPHSGRERYRILPDAVNRFQVQWSQRSFKISLNGDGVSSVSNRQQSLTAALAQVFVWVYYKPDAQGAEANVKPLPSLTQLNAEVKCAICAREFGIRDLRWAVCPDCGYWVCRHHVQRSPTRLCPRCPNSLLDYLGGKASAQVDFVQVGWSQLLGFPQDLHQQDVDSAFPDFDLRGGAAAASGLAKSSSCIPGNSHASNRGES